LAYYEYLVVYVDDILSISDTPMDTMRSISELYRLKDNSIATPKRYLGADVIQYTLSSGYRPELDVTPLLPPEKAQYFQNLIGILRWIIELGRLDIHVHVAMLSSFLAAPREGHLQETFHIFSYLKRYKKSTMVFDDTLPSVTNVYFQDSADWSDFYGDAQEKVPLNAPAPRGNPVNMYCFCDSDHAGDRLTRRSHSGIIIFS